MKAIFEPDYQNKILKIDFEPNSIINSKEDIDALRTAWLESLSSWHSPYKALVNCSNLTISSDGQADALAKPLATLQRVLKGFFLIKIAGYGKADNSGHSALPFPLFLSEKEACQELGIRDPKKPSRDDFRSKIQFLNHFQQHTIEVLFTDPVQMDSKKLVNIFKSKLLNNLMQWHSSWNLLIDCKNLTTSEEASLQLESTIKSLSGFFLKKTVGYGKRSGSIPLPFPLYIARHRACQDIESEGTFSGQDAHCQSTKSKL